MAASMWPSPVSMGVRVGTDWLPVQGWCAGEMPWMELKPGKRQPEGLDVRSSIRLDQIRTVDRQRLVRRLGPVDSAAMAKVDEALKISLGLAGI
jgi:PemK-like, MazF-like toxin of type II toxin-antitoxin system